MLGKEGGSRREGPPLRLGLSSLSYHRFTL
jgi:hypothetical protein